GQRRQHHHKGGGRKGQSCDPGCGSSKSPTQWRHPYNPGKSHPKERAIRMPGAIKQQLGVKIIREDFPIEVLGVPTSLEVQHGKEADNSETIKRIKQGTERIILGFDITRVAWIHGKKSLQPRRDGRAPQAASLIVYTTKEEF